MLALPASPLQRGRWIVPLQIAQTGTGVPCPYNGETPDGPLCPEPPVYNLRLQGRLHEDQGEEAATSYWVRGGAG